jgi:Arc/MetJ-type ribon-helix-helix transcriptional regulator
MLRAVSTQIAVRLPDDLLTFIDEEIRAGRAKDRASIVRAGLERMRRQAAQAEEIALITSIQGEPYPDLSGLAEHAARTPLHLD